VTSTWSPISVEGQACREQQAAHDALLVDAPEVSELGDHFPGLVDDDDLVLLIGADPQVVIVVNRDPVRCIDAGDEDRRLAGGVVRVHRNLDDLMKRGVGDEHDRAGVVEFDTVRTEGRRETRSGSCPRSRPRNTRNCRRKSTRSMPGS
jgi:hypothetical protein